MHQIDPYQGWGPVKAPEAKLNEFDLVESLFTPSDVLNPLAIVKRFTGRNTPTQLQADLVFFTKCELAVSIPDYSVRISCSDKDAKTPLLSGDGEPVGMLRKTRFGWAAGVLELFGVGEFRFQRSKAHGCDILGSGLVPEMTVYAAWQDAKTEEDVAFYAQWPAEKALPQHYPAFLAAGLLSYAWIVYSTAPYGD